MSSEIPLWQPGSARIPLLSVIKAHENVATEMSYILDEETLGAEARDSAQGRIR